MSNETLKPIYLEEQEDEGSWIVSYADMITILLAFFTIFFSFDPTSSGKDLLDKSLENQFAEISLVDVDGNKFLASNATSSKELGVLTENENIILEKIGPGQFGVYFKNISFFNSGDTKVRDEAIVEIDKFVELIRPFLGQYKIKIHSFTDPRPVRESLHKFEDNLELSTLRSLNVFKILKERGLSDKNLDLVGLGVFPVEFLDKYLGVENENKNYHLMRTTMFILERHGSL